MKDNDGHFVRSRLDESALKALAQATGGSYAPLGAQNQGLEVIYREALAPLAKHDLEFRTEKVYIERYQWPLALCLLCLLSSLVVGTRRRAPSPGAGVAAARVTTAARASSSPASAAGAATVVSAAFALLFFAAAGPARASPGSAASAYRKGDFPTAQREYSEAAARDPTQPLLRFDAGTAAYKAGDYTVAAREFQSSLDAAKSGSAQRLAEQQDAYYNLGNTLYRQGQKTEKGDADKTIETWTGAVKAYDAALQLRADDADSKYNRGVVQRKLEELKKKQQSQSQQSKNQNQGGSKDQSQKDQSQGASGNSSAPQQGKDGRNATQPSGADQGQPQQGQGQPQQGQGRPQQGQGQPQQGPGQPRQAQAQSQQAQGQPKQAQGHPQQGDISARRR